MLQNILLNEVVFEGWRYNYNENHLIDSDHLFSNEENK